MPTFDRGFKTWAERTSRTIRRELDLASHDPLDSRELARFLDVDLWTPQEVPGITRDILDQLLVKDPWGWSALSLIVDGHGLVIYNPKKSSGRRASDITHELAHFIMEHEPSTVILSHDGEIAMRTYDRKQEEEANWLASCLLLPREAMVWAKRANLSVDVIAERYGVTQPLVKYRLNVSGVEFQFGKRGRHKS